MNSSNKILAPISVGELIDKITILEIKIEKIQENNLELNESEEEVSSDLDSEEAQNENYENL